MDYLQGGAEAGGLTAPSKIERYLPWNIAAARREGKVYSGRVFSGRRDSRHQSTGRRERLRQPKRDCPTGLQASGVAQARRNAQRARHAAGAAQDGGGPTFPPASASRGASGEDNRSSRPPSNSPYPANRSVRGHPHFCWTAGEPRAADRRERRTTVAVEQSTSTTIIPLAPAGVARLLGVRLENRSPRPVHRVDRPPAAGKPPAHRQQFPLLDPPLGLLSETSPQSSSPWPPPGSPMIGKLATATDR